MTGPSCPWNLSLTHYATVKEQDYEVIYFTDPLDEYMMNKYVLA